MSPKQTLHIQLKAEAQRLGLELKEELLFHPVRKWRFDYAFPELKIAIEYDGHHESGNASRRRAGLPAQDKSGHSTLKGLSGDHEKTNQAQIEGWIVLRVTALFFDEKARKKEKLTGTFATLTQAIDARKASRQDRD